MSLAHPYTVTCDRCQKKFEATTIEQGVQILADHLQLEHKAEVEALFAKFMTGVCLKMIKAD